MSTPHERELLEFAETLPPYCEVHMRPEFRARLRASLLAAPVAFEPARPSLFGWSRSVRPVLAGVLVVALLAAGGGAAAASSRPGDPAFALKRAAEDVQVALSPSEIARFDTLATQSEGRLVDLETLAARRSSAVRTAADEYVGAASRLDATLTRVAAMPPSAQRDAALARAATLSAEHLARLQALASRLPEAARFGIQRAIEVQQTVHGKSGGAPGRGGLGPTPVTPPGRGGPPSAVPGRP